MKRRDLIGTLGATALALRAPLTQAVPTEAWMSDPRRIYDQIARHRIDPFEQGVRDAHQLTRALHRNLPQIIEQNLASMDPASMRHWVDEAEPTLWPVLAALYEAAIHDFARPHILADLLALNLDTERLAKLAPYFGRHVLAQALARWRPEQHAAFLELSAHSAQKLNPGTLNTGPTIEYTLHEVYLSFRTAPIGSLGVRAALYETAAFAGRHLAVAWGAGVLIGSGLAPLIQAHAPGLWHTIGSAVHSFVSLFPSASTVNERGKAQQDLLGPMDVGFAAHRGLTSTGGDRRVVWELPILIGGGGAICWDCHPHREGVR